MKYAEVAVDAPAGYGRTFTYSVPPNIAVLPGHQVRVPFGPRTLQGVVFALSDVPQVPQTRDIIAPIFPEPVVSPQRLELARWMAGYYMCTLFEAAAPMLPPGSRSRARAYLKLAPAGPEFDSATLTPAQLRVVDYLRGKGLVELGRLTVALGQWVKGPVSRLVDRGVVLRSVVGPRAPLGHKYVEYAHLTGAAVGLEPERVAGLKRRAPRQAALLARLASGEAPLTLAEARKEHGASAVRALISKGWVEKRPAAVERDPLAGRAFPAAAPVALTAAQARAVSEVRAAIEEPSASPRVFLVHGVTGSGKTEIYLDAATQAIALGQKAIVLVPEIALTHQTVERFASRFPGRVAVLHSRLTAGEQFDQWWKIKGGGYDVVIGSRGAVFAPQPELGVIVLDEEHEWTYKQADASPRYHAREVALRLGAVSGAVVILGSASPDLESYHRAQTGTYRLLELPERIAVGPPGPFQVAVHGRLPSVEIVDMRRELREGNRGIFSRRLHSSLAGTLEQGAQAVLFLNRRGSASYMQCRSCGSSLRCRRCEVALTYHKGAERLVCHYCGYRRVPPEQCPECLRYRLGLYGAGTEAVAAEVARRFPGMSVLRWDRDAVSAPAEYEDLLRRFRDGDAQVLVGTQMVAKGLHFPAVTLVGVVSADVGLNVPDYRAGERTFQLLCQVAGRAGRGEAEGRVIVQTYQPDNYAIRAAASQDYAPFYRRETAFRKEQGDPPYSRLIRLMYAHTNRAFCERDAIRLSELLREERDAWGLTEVEVLGPMPGYPPRLRGRYRWQVVLRGQAPRTLLDKVTVPHGWVVDVDPVSLAS